MMQPLFFLSATDMDTPAIRLAMLLNRQKMVNFNGSSHSCQWLYR
jgi:hypothetical protein